MVPNEVTVNGVTVKGLEAIRTSQPTQINIHIYQESVLPQLLKTGQSLWQCFDKPNTADMSVKKSRLQLATWTAQIILGMMSVALGVLVNMGPYSNLWSTRAAFWTGAVALLAGVVAIIHERWKGSWWGFLKVLFILATISTTIAAIVIGAGDFNEFYFIRNFCELDENRNWQTPNPQKSWRQSLCIYYMNMLKNMCQGIRIMLFMVWITLLVLTLTPVVLPFRHCCRSNLPPEENREEKKLLHGESSLASPTKVSGYIVL